MRKPKWVLFDYGETLIHEEEIGYRAGYQAILKRAMDNPHGKTVDDVVGLSEDVYSAILPCTRAHNVEVSCINGMRLIFETLGIRFHASYGELEDVFWDAAHPGVPSPHMQEFLHFLKMEDIRIAVVSNLSFSGAALRRRLNRLFPENDFQFVIASSDYAVRKPSPAIFRLALSKTGAQADDVWYVGDNAYADVLGASSVGMTPVWYRSGLACSYRDARADEKPEVVHIRVTDIMQLADIIRNVTDI